MSSALDLVENLPSRPDTLPAGLRSRTQGFYFAGATSNYPQKVKSAAALETALQDAGST